jgi:hypothetical protein
MTFRYEDEEYRIGFRHDRPRDWAAHEKHRISFRRRNGAIELHCDDCPAFLSGMSRAVAQHKTLVVAHLYARQLARTTHCAIYAKQEDVWVPLYRGLARLNTDEGGSYNREIGRKRALRAALLEIKPAPLDDNILTNVDDEAMLRFMRGFKRAAMTAYLDRSREAGSQNKTRGSGGAP